MKNLVRIGSLASAALVASVSALHRPSDDAARKRGGYLVESVALCVQCHTPRDDQGRLIAERRLMGGAVFLANPFPSADWARWAPRIAGLPGYSRDQGLRLLTDHIARDGAPPRLPMPTFRMSRDDAEAVVDYLKSLE